MSEYHEAMLSQARVNLERDRRGLRTVKSPAGRRPNPLLGETNYHPHQRSRGQLANLPKPPRAYIDPSAQRVVDQRTVSPKATSLPIGGGYNPRKPKDVDYLLGAEKERRRSLELQQQQHEHQQQQPARRRQEGRPLDGGGEARRPPRREAPAQPRRSPQDEETAYRSTGLPDYDDEPAPPRRRRPVSAGPGRSASKGTYAQDMDPRPLTEHRARRPVVRFRGEDSYVNDVDDLAIGVTELEHLLRRRRSRRMRDTYYEDESDDDAPPRRTRRPRRREAEPEDLDAYDDDRFARHGRRREPHARRAQQAPPDQARTTRRRPGGSDNGVAPSGLTGGIFGAPSAGDKKRQYAEDLRAQMAAKEASKRQGRHAAQGPDRGAVSFLDTDRYRNQAREGVVPSRDRAPDPRRDYPDHPAPSDPYGELFGRGLTGFDAAPPDFGGRASDYGVGGGEGRQPPPGYEPSRGPPSRSGRRGTQPPSGYDNASPGGPARGRGPGVGPPIASKQSYAEELKEQMRLKAEKKVRDKREREDYERKKAHEVYDPYGKGGAGAPLKVNGQVVTNLRTMKPQEAAAAPGSGRADAHSDTRGRNGGGGGGGNAPGPEPGFQAGGYGAKVTQVVQPGDDDRKNRQLQYQRELQQQAEDAKRRKDEARRKAEEEDRKEAERIAREQERLKAAHEEEMRVIAEKEEAKRRENEEKARVAEEKRLAAIAERKRRDEEADRKMRQQQEEDRRRKEAEDAARAERPLGTQPRAASPPIPTARAARAASPPIPTMAQKAQPPPPATTSQAEPAPRPRTGAGTGPTISEEGPRLSHSRKAKRRPTPANQPSLQPPPPAQGVASQSLMQQLSKLRERLESEQQKVDFQIKRGQEQFTKLQDHQKQRKQTTEVFDRVRRRGSQKQVAADEFDMPDNIDDETLAAALKALQASSPEESEAALREFNALKYRKLTEGRAKHELMKVYPEPPSNNKALDNQQRALLHEQEKEIQHISKQFQGGQASPLEDSDIRPVSVGDQSMLSLTSFNVDAVAAKNEERLRRLQATQRELDSTPEDVIRDFLARSNGDLTSSVSLLPHFQQREKTVGEMSLMADTFYRPGSPGSMAPA